MNYNLEEEVFCLNFELKALSDFLVYNDCERWVPSFCYPIIERDHIERYDFACNFTHNKAVLDLACGTGKGSNIIANNGHPKSILAGDIDPNAVRYATHRSKHNLVKYDLLDGLKIDFKDDFDIVISFETIEHLQNVPLFLKNIHCALKKSGQFIVSTPVSDEVHNLHPNNKYHVQEWGFRKFQEVITDNSFVIKNIYTQLYPPVYHQNNSILNRIYRKLIPKKPQIGLEYKSTIQEFNGTIPVIEMGRERMGYQILVCEKAIDQHRISK